MGLETLTLTLYANESTDTTIKTAVAEMKELYQEEQQYEISYTIQGECIILEERFIEDIVIAINTYSLNHMNESDRELWYDFVGYEDALSWSAKDEDLNYRAIGASNPTEDGYAYVVDVNGISELRAQPPEQGYPKQRVSSTIDKELMRLYNCDTTNVCGILEGPYYDLMDTCPSIADELNDNIGVTPVQD